MNDRDIAATLSEARTLKLTTTYEINRRRRETRATIIAAVSAAHDAGWTYQDIADHLGVSRAYVQQAYVDG